MHTYAFQKLQRPVAGVVKQIINTYPECGLKPEFIGHLAKKIVHELDTVVYNQVREEHVTSLKRDIEAELSHERALAERDAKIKRLEKSQRYLVDLLVQHGIKPPPTGKV